MMAAGTVPRIVEIYQLRLCYIEQHQEEGGLADLVQQQHQM